MRTPEITRIIDVSAKLLTATGHTLRLVESATDMPRTRREFREVHHFGKDVWIWLRRPDSVSRTCVDFFHEVGHAITPLTPRHKFGRDWQPKSRPWNKRSFGRLAWEEHDAIENAATEAQIAVTILAGFPLSHVTDEMILAVDQLGVTPTVLRQVLTAWERAGLPFKPANVRRVKRQCSKHYPEYTGV